MTHWESRKTPLVFQYNRLVLTSGKNVEESYPVAEEMVSLLKSHASTTEVALSQDHKPNDAVERERGGSTVFACEHFVDIS